MSAAGKWIREGATERTLAEPGVVVERTLDDEETAADHRPQYRGDGGGPDGIGGSSSVAWGSHPADLDHRPADLVPAAPAREWDLDQAQELAWSLVGAVLYLLGIIASGIALTIAFHGWVGTLLVLIAGAIPAFYTLRKSAQRRAEKERHERLLAAQERSTGALDLPDFP